ncbi:Cof-type HAD-IIB family hydrolase [Mycoplasma sp. Mirounga ES2805-ORL]|uniref:Cof-type HAD-IIB family hydrolase n=1 Tax=Mycoplasma sp. Mirounga ES2805-ORL TaxID=754514 RepID=UPI00197C655B|nr:Cof-type HAD-IIB family hydrolase [Mycoplasma sp. Mirounga ES2805-ORL]QSF13632.1 Cof-type HAD-IIB family hydrolase [Mycoplasma sp. Mirounga ES2805-ORL]
MLKKPVVFSDVDGTIYTNDSYVSNFNLQAIKGNNLSFNIATGNPICPRMMKLAKLVNADYIIGSSGTQIYDVKKFKYVYEQLIDPEIAKKIFKIFKKYNASAAAWSSEVFYIFKEEDKEFLNKIYFRYESFDQFELFDDSIKKIKPISKMEVYFENTNNLDQIQKELENVGCSFIKTHMNFEILPQNTSKGKAILWMIDNILTDYSRDEIMVIGDSENDFSMFENFEFSYIMDNAKDEIKNKAKFVTKDVVDHGLGHAINDYVERFRKHLDSK